MSENPHKSQKKYWILFTALFLLAVALILPPLINMNRYQRRIADAIGSALGRRVHLSSVTLRLLPFPGLELSDFLVEEDPAFGVEPTLRAQSVTASIRLSSLWRGRLEIGQISLDQPSFNLVRNNEGRWNIGTVLLQASRIPNAPTGQRRASSAPRFPYIEASNARVNFKIGNEKKPFSLFNADFAMWLANPEEWRLRLEAQPVRTDIDLGLSDTGTVRVQGSIHRASALGNMPIDLETEWANAPLGQIGRLLIGEDSGWRGNLAIDGIIKGDVFNPQFKTRIQIAGMHRQEFAPLDAFNVDATCQGNYRYNARSVDDLTCLWPIQNGHFLLTGTIGDIEHPDPALTLRIENVAATFALSAVRLVRNGFADSAQVAGAMQGTLSWHRAALAPLSGEVAITGLALRTSGMDAPLVFPTLHLISTPRTPVLHKSPKARSPQKPAVPSLHLENVDIGLGGEGPLSLSGDFTRQSFLLHLTGDAAIARVKPLAAAFGPLLTNAAASLAPQGEASFALVVHGPWLPQTNIFGNPPPAAVAEGTFTLRNASYQAQFLPDPVEIPSAQAILTPAQIVWNPVSIVFHKLPATLSITTPIPCADPCIREFSLVTPQLDAAALQSTLMGAGEHGEFLQQILSRLDRNKVQWPALNGNIHTAVLNLGPLALHDASTSLHIEGRTVRFTSIDGHALNGLLHATGTMDVTGSAPKYSLDAQLLHANAGGLTSLGQDDTTSGVVSANAHVELAGYSGSDLATSAHGTFHWDWTNGKLDSASLPPHFDHWSADGTIEKTRLVIGQSQITQGPLRQAVSGTISFTGKPDLAAEPEENPPTRVAKTQSQ